MRGDLKNRNGGVHINIDQKGMEAEDENLV